MRKALALLLGLSWSSQALAYDTYLYYDSTQVGSADIAPLKSVLSGVGASIYTTTSTAWPTNWTGYKLAIFILPAAGFSSAQATALENFVNNGGRVAISGDWGGAGGYANWNNRINTLLSNMHVNMSLNNTATASYAGGCYDIYGLNADTLTTGVSYLEVAASNTVNGGTSLLTYNGSSLVSVAQPTTAKTGRTPYDVVLFGDTNMLLDYCGSAWVPGGNQTLWENLYDACADADGDGYTDATCGGTDCNDNNGTVYPGASEACNGVDDDCDGVVDDGATGTTTWYRDSDGDTYGDSGVTTTACSKPAGYVSNKTDCDDGDASVNPKASELCNGVDDDCDGSVDVGAIDEGTWYKDGDGDNYGDASKYYVSCNAPTGYVADDTDCDDRDASAHPGATETPYDGIDQDCDGADLLDVDGDGFTGSAAGGTDCWDGNASVHPGGTETVDGVDEDCDGLVDEGTSAYDDDGDGYSEDGGDCDDNDGTVFPNGTETVDGLDNDCDTLIDEGTRAYDDDKDGYTEISGDCNDSDAAVNPGAKEDLDNGVDDDCDGVVDSGEYDNDADGYMVSAGDCDDENNARYPGAPELADGVDNDCDGVVDEGTTSRDDDGDEKSEEGGDCNDSDPTINAGANEVEDGRDNNCDGQTDEGTNAFDDDGDGFTEYGGDCDDGNSDIAPGKDEAVDAVDNDCDGAVDEGIADADGDGVTVEDGDCDDKNGWVNNTLAELCDSLDNNCDGQIDEGVCGDVADKVTTPPSECGCDGGGGAGLAGIGLAFAGLLRRRRAEKE